MSQRFHCGFVRIQTFPKRCTSKAMIVGIRGSVMFFIDKQPQSIDLGLKASGQHMLEIVQVNEASRVESGIYPLKSGK